MNRPTHTMLLCLLCVVSGACASTPTFRSAAPIEWTAQAKRVILIEPDVVLGELDDRSGFKQRADWSEAARAFIVSDIAAHLSKSGIELVTVEKLTEARDIELARLEVTTTAGLPFTTTAAFSRKYGMPPLPPPTLGPGTASMRERYGADYALFVHIRDSYTTFDQRVVAAVGVFGAATAVALGRHFSGPIPGAIGDQRGNASLVDLRTGDIVWYNRLDNSDGDLRSADAAHRSVDALIKELPL